jgi:predicted TIM-barrel fold metal-dependent hydrolase
MDRADREVAAVEMALLAMESVGVDKALWHGELSLCEAAFRRAPEAFRSIAYFGPNPAVSPDDQGAAVSDVEGLLAGLARTPGIVGIRLTPGWPPTGENVARLRAGGYDEWFAAAEKVGLTVSLLAVGGLLDVHRVAESFAELRILIDHIGMTPVWPGHIPLLPERLDPIPDLLALARHENVAVKFSGVPGLSFESFPFSDLWPTCHAILEAFGPDRVMWGSDFRRLRELHAYRELVDFLLLTDEVSEADKRLMFGESLRRWVRWDESGL